MLEHRFGAILLSNLLTGTPVAELGDEVTPTSLRFQASASSPVDDLLLIGQTADNEERRVSIGVRRTLRFTKSDKATVSLIGSYIRVVGERWDEVTAEERLSCGALKWST